ncbi:MAG: pentapeptide repeat-containing protein [Glaciimonas sp.]|nr:pentapeptide repeat-containing protein [Glaciimonas sp.]
MQTNLTGSTKLNQLRTLVRFYENDLETSLKKLVGNRADRDESEYPRLTSGEKNRFIDSISMDESKRTPIDLYNAGVITNDVDEDFELFEVMRRNDFLIPWVESGYAGQVPNGCWYPMNLQCAPMPCEEIEHQDFTDYDMKGADFDRSSFYKCRFGGADLTGATCYGDSMEDCNRTDDEAVKKIRGSGIGV